MAGASVSSVIASARTAGQIRLAVLDSGLGGVDVFTNVIHRLQKSGSFAEANVTFVNVLPAWMNGYNTLPTTEVKAAVFDRALHAVAGRFHPDLILVACNTLSVLSDHTPFVHAGEVPVVNIVEAGLQLMQEAMERHPDLPLAIFGTPTTIQSEVYQKTLLARSIAPTRIFSEPCTDELTGAIEFGRLKIVAPLIAKHVHAVAERLRDAGINTVLASLNCTHYPYFRGVFSDAFDAEKITVAELLNPNDHMADPLFDGTPQPVVGRSIQFHIVTQSPVLPCHYAAMAALLGTRAPEVVRAFRSHTGIPDLFEWEDLVPDHKPVPPPEEAERTYLGRFGWDDAAYE